MDHFIEKTEVLQDIFQPSQVNYETDILESHSMEMSMDLQMEMEMNYTTLHENMSPMHSSTSPSEYMQQLEIKSEDKELNELELEIEESVLRSEEVKEEISEEAYNELVNSQLYLFPPLSPTPHLFQQPVAISIPGSSSQQEGFIYLYLYSINCLLFII